jgi:nicotinate-nucleotide adenylyltransferase
MIRRQVGVFGGTFDPIHLGHLAAAEDAAARLALDTVLFVPNRIPPHKHHRRVSSAEDRVRMVELAIADNPLFQLSLAELTRDGPSYTLDTMRQLRAELGAEADLCFLTGCDSLSALHTWHHPHELLAEFTLAILDRPTNSPIDWAAVEAHFPDIRRQVRVIPIPLLQVSAEELRLRVHEGRPIRYYVLPAVESYIRQNTLYRSR